MAGNVNRVKLSEMGSQHEAGGFLRMSMMPSPSNQVAQSRAKPPVYFPPTPERAGLYELSVHELTYKVLYPSLLLSGCKMQSLHLVAKQILCELRWWCVQVVAKVGKGETREKVLLNHVSADARPSEVLAIAGPSGSSKTTFLDALAGRIDRNSLKGQILVNGRPMDSAFKRISGYVMQVWLAYITRNLLCPLFV
jgi:ABC-type multidrug transport system fused ATPase/permease subunit